MQLFAVIASCALLLTTVGAVAALFAWLLHATRPPGGPIAAAMLGGCVAGLLLGPGVLGRAAPEVYARVFVGGVDELRALDAERRQVEIDRAALRAAGATEVAVDEAEGPHRTALQSLAATAARARDGVREARAIGLWGAAGATLMFGGIGSLRWRGRREQVDEPSRGAIGAGMASFLLAAVPVALVSRWWLGVTAEESILFGGATGVGTAMLWSIAPAERRSERAVRIAGIAALVAWGIAASALGHAAMRAGGAIAIVVLAMALRRVISARARRIARGVLLTLALPTLVGLQVAMLDPAALGASRGFWIAGLVSVIFSSDGRMLGAWIGWRLLGSDAARVHAWRRSAAMLGALVGPAQICAGALLDTPDLISATIIGALSVEMARGMRVWVARALDSSGREME